MDIRLIFLVVVVISSFFVLVVVKVSPSALGETDCCSSGDHDDWVRRAKEVDVVVIGGGVAGLAAFNTLIQHNITNVVLLEAQDRLGGRVRTFRQGGVLVEDGAEWIHGDQRNSVHRIARSLGELGRPDDDWDWRLMTEEGLAGDSDTFTQAVSLIKGKENGLLAPYYNTSYGCYIIDRFSEVFPPNIPHRAALLHLLEQRVNAFEGTDSWMDIAAEDVDSFVLQGDDFQWKSGYDTLITHLKGKLPESSVRLSSPVSRVIWSCSRLPSQALVVTQDDEAFLAHHVLVTVSAPYIQKHHTSLFRPHLPASFQQNLEGVELGVANKIQIGWRDPWWGSRPLQLFILWTHFNLSDHMSWLYGVGKIFSVYRHKAVLQMFVSGKNSTYMEELQEDEVKDHVMHLLRGATGQEIPQPIFFRRTRWSRDPWTLGSYGTFITMEGHKAGLRHHHQLATPLKNPAGHTVLLWAGEHTHNTRYGTVDGAMESGQREGKRIVQLLKSSP